MSLSPEHVIQDPKSLFLNAIAEQGSVVTNTEDPPAGDDEVKEPKPDAKAKAVKPEPMKAVADDDDFEEADDEFDFEKGLETLSRKIDALSRPQPAAASAARAERGDLRGQLDKLRESIDPEDARGSQMIGLLERMSEKLEQLDKREVERSERAAAQEHQAWEDSYEKDVEKFMEKYNISDKDIIAVARKHRQLMTRDESYKAFSFEEIARRMYGNDALEARRVKRSPGGNGASPAPTARTDAPSGSPIPARGTGGGPPKKFQPGPGRGVGDITESLRKAGIFRGVISETK